MSSTRPGSRPRVPLPHRRLLLAGALAAVGVRSTLLPRESGRRSGRAQVCGAARVLTALGVRVVVVLPDTAWPRAGGRLAVQGSVERIGELAVLTAVPRTVTGWHALAERALAGRAAPTVPADPVDVDAVLLPVAVRYRAADGGELDASGVPRQLGAVLAGGGLVVEVRLLPPLAPSDPRG